MAGNGRHRLPDIGRLAERVMGMDDAAWRRHANPLSGWSRLSALPLLALAICSRAWLGWWALVPVATVLVWIWINPRLFPEPKSVDNWMSQGVLGERIWLSRARQPIARHHEVATRFLNTGASIGVVVLGIGLWLLDVGLILAGLALSMGAKLWFLDRMVWLKSETEEKNGSLDSSARPTGPLDQGDAKP